MSPMHTSSRAWKPARRGIRRTAAATFSALLLIVPAASADPGDLTGAGCFRDVENTGPGCTAAQGLDRGYGVAVSADGRSTYVASADDDTITVFRRDPATGELTWSACFRDATRSATGCTSVAGLDGARGVALSADDASLYVAAGEGDALAAFARDTATGALAYAGCLRDAESVVAGCVKAQGLDDPRDVAVSPDGATVYLGSATDDAVAIFRRDPATSGLAFSACVRDVTHSGAGCAKADGLDGPRGVAVSPDGAWLYVASRDGDSIASFRRAADGAVAYETCFRDTENAAAAACAPVQGLDGPHGVAVSPDGRSIYFPSETDDTVVTFQRESGTLAYGGCLRDIGQPGTGCPTVEGLNGARQVDVSHDGASVYVAAADDDAVVVFDRAENGALTWDSCARDAERTANLCTLAQGLDGARGVIASGDGRSVYVASEIDDTAVAFAREQAPAPPPPPPADTTAPTVSWTAPATDGAVVKGVLAESGCAVSASDDTAVARVEFRLDGQLLGTDTTAPFGCTWDTTQSADGEHTLSATAYDAAGNQAGAARTVTVSNAVAPPPPPPPPVNQAPSITLTAPVQGQLFRDTLSFAATASDDDRVTLVEFYVDGVKRASDTTAPYGVTWSSKSLAWGFHKVVARAYDAQGLSTTTPTVTVERSKRVS